MPENLKVLIIGLDGATFRLIRPWIDEGHLPAFDFLLKNGCHGILRSTFPPTSAPAWATFLTGVNPGIHGIFGFGANDATQYSFYNDILVNSSLIAGHTFLDIMSANGLNCFSLKIPLTYPPWNIRGVMISGQPSPDERKAFTFPKEFAKEIGNMSLFSPEEFQNISPDDILTQFAFETQKRFDLTLNAINELNYNVIISIHNTPDAAHHRLWRYMDKKSPLYTKTANELYGDYILRTYTMIDEKLTKIFEAIPEECITIIMSDHGAAMRASHYVNINYFLHQNDYLVLKSGDFRRSRSFMLNNIIQRMPPSMKRILRKYIPQRTKEVIQKSKTGMDQVNVQKTVAYHYPIEDGTPTTGIEVNLIGRQVNGIVPTDQYENVCMELSEKLSELTDDTTGKKIIKNVFLNHDIYHGQHSEKMSDLLIEFCEGYDLGYSYTPPLIEEANPDKFKQVSGTHDFQGIFMMFGQGVKEGNYLTGLQIADLAPTILFICGLPIPTYMDGRIILEAFEKDFISTHKEDYVKTDYGTSELRVLGDEEMQEMKKHLAGLGYLDK